MIGDKAKEMLADHTVKRTFNPRCLISKTEKLPQRGDSPMNNPDLFYTTGSYSLAFRPSAGPNVRKQDKFIIRSDIFQGSKRRMASYEVMKSMAKNDWSLAFLLKWTNINQKLFDIAAKNISVQIPFTFKVEEYAQMLQEKYGCNEYCIYREIDEADLEFSRIHKIKFVQWELPVKIEV